MGIEVLYSFTMIINLDNSTNTIIYYLYIYYNILVRAKLRKKCHNYIQQIFKSVTLVVF